MSRAAALLTGAACAACSPAAPELASCGESLAGVWRGPDGRTWTILDRGPRLEVFPAFADTQLPPAADPALALEAAPRAIDLTRVGAIVTGVVHRRFGRGAAECDPAPPVRVTACRGATLTVELPEPPAPTAVEPCAFAPTTAPVAQPWTWVGPAE